MRISLLNVILATVLAGSLAGCSAAADSAPAPVATGSAPSVSGVPRPSAEQGKSLMAELGKVHPALNHDRSVGRARNVCEDILNNAEDSFILDRAKQRFEGGSTGPLTQEHASQIVAVIKANGFCVK